MKPESDIQASMFGMSSVVPGSAASIVADQRRAREAKNEKLINDMKDDFPQLARIYDALKGKAI